MINKDKQSLIRKYKDSILKQINYYDDNLDVVPIRNEETGQWYLGTRVTTNYCIHETLKHCAFLLSGKKGETIAENLNLINENYGNYDPNKLDVYENKRNVKLEKQTYKYLKNWAKLTGKSVNEIAEIMLKNGMEQFDKSVELEEVINERVK